MTVWCFQCSAEYDDDSVTECRECGVPTVDTRPADPTEVGDEGEDQIAYELHAWAGSTRRLLDGMLSSGGVAHAWQGATLIVREADEEAVDEAVRSAELSTMPKLDPDEDTMAYELDEFTSDDVARVAAALVDAGIAHDFDSGGDLIVHERDEEAVDALFEQLDTPVQDEFAFGPGVDGVDAHDVLSSLLFATSTLKRDPGDVKAAESFSEQTEVAYQLQLPFGFSAIAWRQLLDQLADTQYALTSPELEADEVQEIVEETHDQLRPLV